ncbi:MAG: septal ring lytic transglycosylase RlpA family protein [Candidatus Obscuribacterales bacterium]|nr:septal ring lytic transglycosylase RlpA family protein [Candidatus Obscuribacterales bacterium]
MRKISFVYPIALASVFLVSLPALAAQEEKTEGNSFSGLADYYHHKLYGQKTASGEVLKKEKLTAAHRTLPFGTKVKVMNKRSGKSCVVVINDRGPFTKGKVIDLSHEAARQLGVLEAGTASVACLVLEDTE